MIHTENLSLKLGDGLSKSYLACPREAKAPGILMLHEFWGLTENIKSKARRLAERGFAVLAPDLYGDGWIADSADKAKEAMQNFFSDMDRALSLLRVFLSDLKNLKQTEESRIGAMGYCMGGALSLHLVRTEADSPAGKTVQGAVSIHGNLEPRHAVSGQIKAKILALNGAADPFVPAQQIENFKKEMERAGADFRLINYPGALHGFTNPQATENGKKFNLPLAYDEAADKASFEETAGFFKNLFHPSP